MIRLRLRFTTRTLLATTAVVAVILVATFSLHWRYFSPSGVYQTRKNGSALLGLLSHGINNGDTRASVITRLGRGTIIDGERALDVMGENMVQQPVAYPDGFQKTDVFVMYSAAEGFALHLQFRDNRLVNFNLPPKTRQALSQHCE